jgi:pimeloyl-ACP methyl ester carboxylesterase
MNDQTPTLQHVTSADGTTIAYDRLGSGPPVVLVCGGSTDRQANAGLAAVLATNATVYNFDRRGRGDSADTLPYAIEREIEDIEAVIGAAGGEAFLWGSSSGAALALEATAAGARVSKLALWEPPYFVDDTGRPPLNTAEVYERFVAEGRRGDAVEFFMAKVVGLPPEFVAFARSQPFWAGQEAIAHTLAYDARIMGDYGLPTRSAAAVRVPTLVLTGGASFPFFRQTADALVELMPNARAEVLDGQEHNVDPGVLGAALATFFAA